MQPRLAGRVVTAARSGTRSRRPASWPGWGTGGRRSPSGSNGEASRASAAATRPRERRERAPGRETGPTVLAVPGSRPLDEHRHVQVVGSLPQRADVVAPARGRRGRSRPASRSRRRAVGRCRSLMTFEVAAHLGLRQRNEAAVACNRRTSPSACRTGRAATRSRSAAPTRSVPAPRALPARREDVGSPAKQGSEQRDATRGGRDVGAVGRGLELSRSRGSSAARSRSSSTSRSRARARSSAVEAVDRTSAQLTCSRTDRGRAHRRGPMLARASRCAWLRSREPGRAASRFGASRDCRDE